MSSSPPPGEMSVELLANLAILQEHIPPITSPSSRHEATAVKHESSSIRDGRKRQQFLSAWSAEAQDRMTRAQTFPAGTHGYQVALHGTLHPLALTVNCFSTISSCMQGNCGCTPTRLRGRWHLPIRRGRVQHMLRPAPRSWACCATAPYALCTDPCLRGIPGTRNLPSPIPRPSIADTFAR